MKKMKSTFAATSFAAMIALAAPAAWAGSGASVTQTGDQNYSIVLQRKNKTVVESWTATTPIEKFKSDVKIMKAAKQGARPNQTRSRYQNISCSPFFNGGNVAFASQNGSGNSAYASQQGAGNYAGTVQDGRNNTSYMIQKGNGHEAMAGQYGNNNTSLIVQRC